MQQSARLVVGRLSPGYTRVADPLGKIIYSAQRYANELESFSDAERAKCGDKRTQDRDINTALELAREL